MWGCFQKKSFAELVRSVFPTHVGVFPRNRSKSSAELCLPHACGGVSEAAGLLGKLCESSPRMWGCFQFIPPSRKNGLVFPTHVGVFPVRQGTVRRGLGLPHACGGVSLVKYKQIRSDVSSPRMWGCFYCGFSGHDDG